MKNKGIESKLNSITTQSYSLDEFNKDLQIIKEQYVKSDKQEEAKQIWIYQRIIEIHQLYINAYNLLNDKEYFDGWCQLERIEITIVNLKKHFNYDKNQFHLWHIERKVKDLQVIFPYRLFGSSEILKKKKKCSVCDKEVSIRNPCGHFVGEIYNGEICTRIVTEMELLGLSLVENPGNKFSVMFTQDETTGKQIDQYNYTPIDYLFEHIEAPYENWYLEVSQLTVKKEDYGKIERNDFCNCNSRKKFKKCCGLNIGKKYPKYEFILQNPSDKKLFTNTLKAKASS
jgi:hypothetical protein